MKKKDHDHVKKKDHDPFFFWQVRQAKAGSGKNKGSREKKKDHDPFFCR